jgi:putative transposase
VHPVGRQKPASPEAKQDAHMDKGNVVQLETQASPPTEAKIQLELLLRQGAQRMLQQAIHHEVEEFVASHLDRRTPDGHQAVVRNGSLPSRKILTGLGPLEVQQPRVRDRSSGERIAFSSVILPKYLRRVPSIDALIPALYLRGISTGDFTEALSSILGPNAAGLSVANIVRLKEGWQSEYEQWSRRDFEARRYVYWWADGVYFQVRLEDQRRCILVLMGALADGTKELIAVTDGERESKLSWLEILRDLKARGLKEGPSMAVGDGGLGFWAALNEEFPQVREQRCWVHKTANVLDKFPKSLQPAAKDKIHQMYLSPTRETAMKAFDAFISLYDAKYPKACECLRKDQDILFNFYDFPAQHWGHLRTTNPIESTFATVRLRTERTKGCGSRMATLTMVWQLARAAQKRWRRLNSCELLTKVIEGIAFVDGEEKRIAA